MYTIERKNRIREDLELRDGEKTLQMSVDLNVDEMQGKAVKAYKEVAEAQETLRKAPDSEAAMEAYGKAAISLFTVIFGKAGAQKILDFYENHYTEMLLDIFPFINTVIIPKIAEASAARKAQLVEAARATKKRGLFK